MTIHLDFSGYCTANQRHTYKGATSKKTVFPAFWAVMQHPTLGYILFDAGYSTHFFDATKSFPNILYRWLMPVFFDDKNSVKKKLKNTYNIDIQDIKYIIISHFHGDHLGGLPDFQHATYICSRRAYEHIHNFSNFWAFRKAYLKKLLPQNMAQRTLYIEDMPTTTHEILGKMHHWQAADLQFLPLGGHCKGQIGVLLDSKGGDETGKILLAADAAWDFFSIKNNAPPPSIIRFFIDNYKELVQNIQKLYHYHKAYPDTKIIVSHCKTTLEKYFKIP
jgi:glyoxylase-like metal-dependent hydrolase (beta-lactamase superfamily II)